MRRDTIRSWELSSKTPIFLAELLCSVERESPSKLSSTISKAERHSKSFSRGFPPCRVKLLSPFSRKQSTCYSPAPKCAFSFDECIDERFRNSLTGHDCQTARYAGLAGLTNGDLLKAAEAAKFDVLLTVDQGIEYQQNLTGLLAHPLPFGIRMAWS